MPEFGDVKQAHLPEQTKLPGDETRFIKQGGVGKSGDWMTELGNAALNFLEQGVKDILRTPVDLVAGAAKAIGNGLSSASKGIYEGLKEAVKEIKQDLREAKSSPREPSNIQRDGQREAKSSPSRQSTRPNPDSKQEQSSRTDEPQSKAQQAKPRERDFSQNNSPKYGQARPNGPSSAMDPAQHKTWADAPAAATTSIKVHEHPEPTVRANGEPAKDVAARTVTQSDQTQAVKKESEAPPIVRKDHASGETPEQKVADVATYKVNSEKVADKLIARTVASILGEIRASKEAPKTKESERAPEKSPERTR
jgi:hypothetical protein